MDSDNLFVIQFDGFQIKSKESQLQKEGNELASPCCFGIYYTGKEL
jgi:hypothetical protein